MATVSTYLNFRRETEEAFNFYKKVFGTEFLGEINRYGSMPPHEGVPPLSDADKNLVLHLALPILGGHLLMGSDIVDGMGFTVDMGNNVQISLHPDSREQADELFAKLSEGGKVTSPMMDQFWGDYFGSFIDKFGIYWMINYHKA